MIQEFLRHISLELNRSQHTVKAYETDLRGFNDFIVKSGVPTGDSGFFVPEAVTLGHIREWMATLSETRQTPSTVRRKVQALRAYFRFLVKAGVLTSNPARLVALPKTGRRLPTISTHDDIEHAIAEAREPLEALVIELLYGCGLRRSELCAISDPDINPYNRELKILGKGNKHRVIPLPQSMLEHIQQWQQERDILYPELEEPKPLIATRRGRMSTDTLYRLVRRALSNSNAEKKSPHTLRHSFATQVLNSGADINSVKELLGHSSLGATQIYTHVAFSELAKEWNKAHPRSKDP